MTMTMEELREKIDCEGGVWGAITYGIDAEDIPEELRADWRKMLAADEIADRVALIVGCE